MPAANSRSSSPAFAGLPASFLAALLWLVSASCSSPSDAGSVDTERADLCFVFIVGGAAKPEDFAKERLRELTLGHFDNMTALAEAGRLVLAGPLGPPRADARHRGIYVFDTADPVQALEWGATDPAVQAGLFALEALPWRGPASLRRIPELDSALLAQQPEGAGPGATAKPYVIATVTDVDAARVALQPLRDGGQVPVFGALGGDRRGEGLLIVDAEDVDVARALLTPAGVTEGAALLPFFATRALTMLR